MGLTNNDIFKKLRVAHKLRDDDIVNICKLVDFKVSKSELGALFRKEDHPKYMECGDQRLTKSDRLSGVTRCFVSWLLCALLPL